ncbi:MAG: hypothetical protein WD025_05560, partial [Bacteriovoracaceae bacterium]
MKKILILSAILFFSSPAWSKSNPLYSHLLYNAPQDLKREMIKNHGAKEVFSPKEKEFLAGEDVETNLLKLELDPEQTENLRLKIKASPGTKLQTNPAQTLYSQTPDPYKEFQWGLNNLGTDLIEWDSDIDVTTTSGVPGEDVGLKGLKENPEKKIKVAIVDSGIDIHHPDLKNQIKRNEKECA